MKFFKWDMSNLFCTSNVLFALHFCTAFLVAFCSLVPHLSSQTTANVQIQRGNGPFTGRAKSIVQHNRQLFVVVADADSYILGSRSLSQSGIYRSADNGTSWQLVPSFPAPAIATSIYSFSHSLFVLTSGEGSVLYRSQDDGATWEIAGRGTLAAVTHLVPLGDTLFARTGLDSRLSNMYTSIDTGKTWTLVSSPGSIGSVVATRGRSSAVVGRSLLFGGSPNGLIRSANRGLTWQSVSAVPDIKNAVLYDLATKSNDQLYLATNQGVFSSSDNGQTWSSFNTGLEGKIVQDFAVNADVLYAAANDGLYVNQGATWRPALIILNSFTLPSINALSLDFVEGDTVLFVGSQSGVFRANMLQNGRVGAWKQVNRGLPGVRIGEGSLSKSGSTLLAASTTAGVVRAADGIAWTNFTFGLEGSGALSRLAASKTTPIAVVANKTSIYTSNDAGLTWRTPSFTLINDEITALSVIGATSFFIGTRNGSIFRSNGASAQSWSRVVTNPLDGSAVPIQCFLQNGDGVVGGTAEGIIVSNDNGTSWQRVDSSAFPRISTFALIAAPALLLAGTVDGIYRSIDSGRTWQSPSPSAKIGTVSALAERNGLLFAGTEQNGLYRSTDYGNTWMNIAISDQPSVTSLLTDSTRLLIGVTNGIYEYVLPLAEEFPIITSLQPSDSAFVGLGDVALVINGQNFAVNARVSFDGQILPPQSQSGTKITVLLPIKLLQNLGTKILEVINSPTSRINTTFRVVPLPKDFPQVRVIGELSPFTALITQTSTPQRYTLSVANIRDSLVIQVPQSFEVSLDSGKTWTTGRTAIAQQNNTIFRDIFLRFRPLGNQTINGAVSHTIGGLTFQTLVIVGNPINLQLDIQPGAQIAFGSTRLGQNLAAIITLSNPNPVNIILSTVISGANADDFSASAQQIVIPPSSRIPVAVTFSPRARGDREAMIQFTGIASGQVTLRGSGVQAIFSLAPREIVFATSAFVSQTVRLPSEAIQITNTGDVDDVLTGLLLQGASGAFRIRNFTPIRLQARESVAFAIDFVPDSANGRNATLSIQTQDSFTGTTTANIRGQGQDLLPPVLTFPGIGAFVGGSAVPLSWQPTSLATHYEVVFDSIANASSLQSRRLAITSSTSAVAQLQSNRSYYWSVRSLVVFGSDTIRRSAWQNWQFFSTSTEKRISIPPILNFGTIAKEQQQSPPRSHPITVPSSSSWSVLDIGIVQENDAPNSDFQAFSILNRDVYRASGRLLRPFSETYPIAVSFRPTLPRLRPFTAIAELRVQNNETNEIVVLPFQLMATVTSCTSLSAAITGNQGCPETVLKISVSPNKQLYAPGDEIRLQVQLLQTLNFQPNIDRFARRLRLVFDVQNISLMWLQERLTQGSAADPASGVRVIPYSTAQTSSNLSEVNPNGKIVFDVARPSNSATNLILAEITGKATIGLQGITTKAEESSTAAIIRLSHLEWLSDSSDALDNGQILVWGDERSFPVNRQQQQVTVNTCQTTNSSLFLTATFPVNIQPLAPNPVFDETTMTFSLQEQGWVDILLYNAYGQMVKKIVQSEMMPGEYSLRISVADLPSGAYFIELRTPYSRARQKMEVIR